MSDDGSSFKDDSWFGAIDCPSFFDFSAALQFPCHTESLKNPPLHDYIYESDEESRRFFRLAAESSASPRPKPAQQRVLDPSHYGEPIYRHRPDTSFDEYVREYEAHQERGARKTVRIASPAAEVSTASQLRQLGSLTDDEPATPRLSPKHSFLGDAGRQLGPDCSDGENEDIAEDLKTPTLDSIITPVTVRRTRQQITPSRLLKPTNLSKSLFYSSPSSASPHRKQRLSSGRSGPFPTDSLHCLRSSTIDSATIEQDMNASRLRQGENRSTPARISKPCERKPGKPTDETSSSDGHSAGARSAPKCSSTKARPHIARSVEPSPDTRIRPPQRATRHSPSTASPEDAFSHAQNGRSHHEKEESSPVNNMLASETVASGTKVEMRLLKPTKQSRRLGPAFAAEVRPVPTRCNSALAGDGEDSDIVRKLHEHNRRLRGSARLMSPPACEEERSHKYFWRNQQEDQPEKNKEATQPDDCKRDGMHFNAESQAGRQKGESPSLSDILQSQNNVILQRRRDRLPERSKALLANRESALRRHDQKGGASSSDQKRVLTNVEFTSSAAVKPGSNGVLTQKAAPKNRMHSQRGMPNPRSSVRSTSPVVQQHNASVVVARSRDTLSDKLKESAQQRREEQRMENHLQSILSQHNSRVKNKRRTRA